MAHAERVQSQADENIVRNILHRELIVQLSIVLSDCLKSELCVIGFIHIHSVAAAAADADIVALNVCNGGVE